MKFAEKIYYSDIDSFPISENKALNLGFLIESDIVVIPAGTRFKLIEEVGPGGWPVIEVFGQELDFALEEPVLVSFD